MSIPALATDMIGYDIHEAVQKPRMIKEESILSFRDFSVQMPGEQLHGIHLDVKKEKYLALQACPVTESWPLDTASLVFIRHPAVSCLKEKIWIFPTQERP